MPGVDLGPMAHAVRFLSMDAIERAGEGHPGTPLGAADTATALFTRHLKFNPQDPLWFDRDRFVQSPGHGSMLIYSLLHLVGYEKIGIEEIKRFRVLGSHCEGHPEYDPTCGIEVTTGLLQDRRMVDESLALVVTGRMPWRTEIESRGVSLSLRAIPLRDGAEVAFFPPVTGG